MNACAVMQNGATLRYTLAINLWREMRAEASGGVGTLLSSYSDPSRAMSLASRRIRLLLVALNLLYMTVAGFGVATLAGLIGSFVYGAGVRADANAAVVVVIGAATLATCGLLAAMVVFVLESRATQILIRLQVSSTILSGRVGLNVKSESVELPK